MIFREAEIKDIEALMSVRMSAKENRLNNPALVTPKDNEEYLTIHGKGWVCDMDNEIVGFAIVGLTQRNIWALFVRPEYERMGIGRQLHNIMLDWYFNQTKEKVWLGTAPHTRAENFYRKSGWTAVGTHGKGEIKFEVTYHDWAQIRKSTANDN